MTTKWLAGLARGLGVGLEVLEGEMGRSRENSNEHKDCRINETSGFGLPAL